MMSKYWMLLLLKRVDQQYANRIAAIEFQLRMRYGVRYDLDNTIVPVSV